MAPSSKLLSISAGILSILEALLFFSSFIAALTSSPSIYGPMSSSFLGISSSTSWLSCFSLYSPCIFRSTIFLFPSFLHLIYHFFCYPWLSGGHPLFCSHNIHGAPYDVLFQSFPSFFYGVALRFCQILFYFPSQFVAPFFQVFIIPSVFYCLFPLHKFKFYLGPHDDQVVICVCICSWHCFCILDTVSVPLCHSPQRNMLM